ncbi:zinc finger protein 134-like [Rousettus aegyptiacus]|uniref:zinc finger protein 134-like n=1 Tax=Rousettus aegyptiacus TaxID=9407 RepID=UPI00168D4EAF|nr:zinc finger protein 134-like [Rousettus aegyptiacus]
MATACFQETGYGQLCGHAVGAARLGPPLCLYERSRLKGWRTCKDLSATHRICALYSTSAKCSIGAGLPVSGIQPSFLASVSQRNVAKRARQRLLLSRFFHITQRTVTTSGPTSAPCRHRGDPLQLLVGETLCLVEMTSWSKCAGAFRGAPSQGLDTAVMAEAAAGMGPPENFVTFEDVYLNLTREEWELLSEGQKHLYYKVMLDNFLLASSVGLAISRSTMITQSEPVREPKVPDKTKVMSGISCSGRVKAEGASCEQGVPVRVSQVGPSVQKSHQCDTCDPILKAILHLAEQQGVCSGQQTYPCKSCGTVFWFSVNPDQIPRQQIGETFPRMEKGQAPSVNYIFHRSENAPTCWDDGEDLTSSGLVQPHATHAGERPCRGDECEAAFNTEQKCSECEKIFGCSSSPQVSERIPPESRPHVCDECGKAFSRKSQLVQHKRIHTGAKPYECSECHKAFGRKDTLVQHQKIHTGERPYVCNRCGKTFIRRDALLKHEKVHTGEKSYRCDRCGKLFSHSSYVKVHKRVHCKTSSYTCNQCGKVYPVNPHVVQQNAHTLARPVGEVNVEEHAEGTATSLGK